MKHMVTKECSCCGACVEIRPDIFAVRREGHWQDVWMYDEEDVIDCALACPKNAIRIDEY
jgi:ferredoxin